MSFGYRPLLAGNGRSAVEIVAESGNRIRAVVLDLTMPEMSGEETLQQLRAIQPGLPVIIASGYGETEINERFEGQTISAFLQKPYTPVQLAKTIRYAIGA
jgi:DNA-binding NtrC family response regulator